MRQANKRLREKQIHQDETSSRCHGLLHELKLAYYRPSNCRHASDEICISVHVDIHWISLGMKLKAVVAVLLPDHLGVHPFEIMLTDFRQHMGYDNLHHPRLGIAWIPSQNDLVLRLLILVHLDLLCKTPKSPIAQRNMYITILFD